MSRYTLMFPIPMWDFEAILIFLMKNKLCSVDTEDFDDHWIIQIETDLPDKLIGASIEDNPDYYDTNMRVILMDKSNKIYNERGTIQLS